MIYFLFLSVVSYATDIVSYGLENPSGTSQSGVLTTFGQVFKEGDVGSGVTLSARLGDGTSVPLQVNKMTNHNDGSLRHAILTAQIPTLASGGDALILSTGGSALGGSAVSLAQVLASGFDATVSLDVGGTVYSASAKDLLQNTIPTVWFSGPLASEWLVGGPVKTSGGGAHNHLAAYFHVRAYSGLNAVRVDVVIENNWTLVASPSNRNYSTTIKVGGVTVFSDANSFTHYHHARWHKRFWWGTEPSIYVKHDHDYLQDSKAIPKYEDLTPTEGFLNSVRQSTAPMNRGDQQANMQDPGFQPGIGPLPQWDAVYAISGDRRAFYYMLANADAGGSYSIHYRDKSSGQVVSIDDYPNTSLADPSASNPVIPEGSGNPYYEGNWSSHQPSIGFLPYLVTGDYYYLEEAMFWTAYNLIWPSADGRNGAAGWWYTGSLRGQAWAYRSLAQVAYITPDSHPMKSYFLSKLVSNLDRDYALYVSPGGPHKNNLGAMYMAEGNEQYRFYDYFMSWVSQYLVDLGFTQAEAFRDYKLQFPIGLMGINAGEYCFQVSAQYTWQAGPTGTSTFYNDFGEMYAQMFPALVGIACGTQAMANALGVSLNEITAEQFSTSYYYANLQPAIAAAADSGLPGGQAAWERGQLSGVHPDYRDEPIWAVIPHGLSGPAIAFTATPVSVVSGENVTLNWSAPTASSCTASGDWSGAKPTTGNQVMAGITSAKTYTLACTDSNGTSRRTVNVFIKSADDPGGGQGSGKGGGGYLSPFTLIPVLIIFLFSYSGRRESK